MLVHEHDARTLIPPLARARARALTRALALALALTLIRCTSTTHDRNVGLLVRLNDLALVTGVGVVNPAEGFDCPVKLLLAYADIATSS